MWYEHWPFTKVARRFILARMPSATSYDLVENTLLTTEASLSCLQAYKRASTICMLLSAATIKHGRARVFFYHQTIGSRDYV